MNISYRLVLPKAYVEALSDYKLRVLSRQNDNLLAYELNPSESEMQRIRALVKSINIKGESAIFCPSRSFQAIVFDMDSTLIAQESIVELARFAGASEQVSEVTERAMAGELDFKQALKERVACLKGQGQEIINQTLAQLSLNEGVEAFTRLARDRGIELHLVSGGFSELASAFADRLGFNGFKANFLEIHQQLLTGRTVGDIVDAQAKEDYVCSLESRGIDLSRVLVVGDGANDLKMMSRAGVAIGFKPKDVLIEHISGAVYESMETLSYLLLDS